jgi:hypothetical protein
MLSLKMPRTLKVCPQIDEFWNRLPASQERANVTEPFPGILAIFNNVAAGREAEFEEWFQHEHLAERMSVPGFLLGRRHEVVSGWPGYFNFYVTQSANVLRSAAYLRRLDHPTPMTRIVMSEIFKDMIRTVCHRTYRSGAMRGAAVATARFAESPDERVSKTLIDDLLTAEAIACGEIWRAASARDFPVSEEERLRGGDRKNGRLPADRNAARAGCREGRRDPDEQISARRDRRLSAAVRDQAVGLGTRVSAGRCAAVPACRPGPSHSAASCSRTCATRT